MKTYERDINGVLSSSYSKGRGFENKNNIKDDNNNRTTTITAKKITTKSAAAAATAATRPIGQ